MLHLTLTNEEANAMAGIIDVAVKAVGVKLAAPAMGLMQKLEAAAQAAAQKQAKSSVIIEEED